MSDDTACLACAVVIVGAACGAALAVCALYALLQAYIAAVLPLAQQTGILP